MEGGSPDQESFESCTRKPNTSLVGGGRAQHRKEFLRRFVDSDVFTSNITNWLEEVVQGKGFNVPFELIDLQKFDYALEGVPFQQLVRMPSALHISASTSGTTEASAYLGLEDFLHASIKSLWESFWSQDEPLPLYVSSIYGSHRSFYQAEKVIAKGRFKELCATAVLLKNPRHPQGKWDDILQVALLRPDVASILASTADGYSNTPSTTAIGEALFFAVRVILARSLSKSKNIALGLNSVFVLLLDSQYGGVLKVEGDVNEMEVDVNNVYECTSEWIKNHCSITISPVDRIWNKLGNANWRDIGALQFLFATFNSIIQYAGMPKNTVEDLAADHSSRLQARRIERQMIDSNGNGVFRFQQRNASPEIVEVPNESESISARSMKLEVGSVLWLEDPDDRKRGYQINEVVSDGEIPYYIATSLEDHNRSSLFLYVGSPPSQVEPAWEDMKLWYQVQRQTKMLSVMKQKGLSSKYLPQLSVSGKIVHPGQCRRPSLGANCDHPWCGTPILVTSPVGRTVADMVRAGKFDVEETIKCCHDCLSALHAAASAGIRHGDIRPENVIFITSGEVGQQPYFVLIGWGHAILEERDHPAMNLHFSSTYALQEGKLCSASDAESLVYMLYFCSSGMDLPDLDSVEGALSWRETSWSRRLIQQKLGDISAVLKAFADYVDSLCGTPYPIDYEIWLRRLRRHIQDYNNHGKGIEMAN